MSSIFFKGFGVRVFDYWIRSKLEYESIEGFGLDLTQNSDSRPIPKDSVKSISITVLILECWIILESSSF